MGKKMKHDKMAGRRKFLDLLQDRWSEAITPGGWLVIDESMVAWLGVLIKMPGWKAIKRKPHPFGLIEPDYTLKTSYTLSSIGAKQEVQDSGADMHSQEEGHR
jgi:hypothetical protein